MSGFARLIASRTGQREALIAILLVAVGDMPRCRSYVVAKDPRDEHAIWWNGSGADTAAR
jgi:hypothetical protein